MELRMAAARRRISFNALVREKLGIKEKAVDRSEFWERLEKFSKAVTRQNPGVSLSQKLIEMRYEQ